MKNNIFISHSSYDKDLVEILAELINRVSLNQIKIWFSNDTNVNGGFMIGEDWYETIINNLNKSDVVITFITPNSNNQPWILFESGYAEALKNCILVPTKFSININDISLPLQHKQIYNLSNVEDLHIFLSKLLSLFNLQYDKEIFLNIAQNYLKKMRKKWENNNQDLQELDNTERMINNLEQKVDYYFGNIKEKQQENIFRKYEVILEYNINNQVNKEYITISQNATVKDVLNEIYYMISNVIEPFTYLKSWVLLETKTKRAAIISEDVYDWIPAQNIFKINTLWRVKFLTKPLIID